MAILRISRSKANRCSFPLLLGLLAILLGGCQRTLFEHAPASASAAASSDCDQDLVGHWLSNADGDEEPGEVQAFIDASCTLRTLELRIEGPRESSTTQLKTLILGRQRLLSVPAAWANQSFDVRANTLDHADDVYLFAYRLRGADRLQLLPVRHRQLAQLAVAGKLEADVLLEDGNLTVRVRGDAPTQHAQLRRLRLFDRSEPLNFVRAEADE